MKKNTLAAFLSALLFTISSGSYAQSPDVLTQHNDFNRTGWNPLETILTQSNVTPTNFGLLYKRAVDEQIYAQPLYVSGVTVTDPITHLSAVRNVLYVATVNNTVYAFDADDGTLNPYWQINFTPPGELVPGAIDIHASLCGYTYVDLSGNYALGQKGIFGIVGTPVIDKATNTIYFVSRYRDQVVDNAEHNSDLAHQTDQGWSSAGFFQLVHALDLGTGAEKFNGPRLIDPVTTAIPGMGPGHDAGNMIHFDTRRNNQRGGLFISNGIVYIPYAGHCDMDDYHGWILGYQANDLSHQLIRYATTPNDERGGIWMSGAGPALDAAGNIYYANGNANDVSLATSPNNVGLSVVKTSPDLVNHTLTNVTWLKPSSYHTYNTSDLDFGTGVILIPGTNMLVTAHKTGKLFLIKNLGSMSDEFNESSSNVLSYDLGAGSSAQSHSGLTYYAGSPTPYIYQFSEHTHVTAFPVNIAAQTLGTMVTNTSIPVNGGLVGGFSSGSSNGSVPGSGILWVTHDLGTGGGTIHALKADDITQELWNSDGNATDVLGRFSKMSSPTIANGRVYVPTFSNFLNVYGLLASNTRCVTNVALNKTGFASGSDGVDLPSSAFDGNLGSRWANSGQSNYLYVDLGARYDVCKISIRWDKATPIEDYGADFTIQVSDDAITWTILNTVTGNLFSGDPAINNYNEHTTGRFVKINITKNGNLTQAPGGPSPFISITEFEVYGSPANNCIAPAVVNMTATSITQSSATLQWKPVTGITDYIIKYRGPTVTSYITRTLHDGSGTNNTLSLPISALTCGFNYEFDIQSVCAAGALSAPAIQIFTTSPCSSPCLNLTRFYHGDLGDINAPGMSCYAAPTFTVTGAGSGIGGTSDQFQFNYTSLNKDEEFIMRIASQDLTLPNSQAGIMMRDSVTDYSRFMFIGRTGDNRLTMIYRNTNGGTAVPMFLPNIGNANYFRIVKAGTQYGAFYGNSIAGPWTQMGATQNLQFGGTTLTMFIGMAVSSLNATTTSTASFDNFLENSTALPIQLINFTATNEHDEFVSLKWQTAMEENNDHFEIERSTNGTNFSKIVTAKAVGNSNTIQSYSASDNRPENGLNFYRLKQVDIDGRFTNSAVKTVKFGEGVSPVIFPNPVSSVFTAVPGSELIREIVIYNVLGKAMQFAMGNSTDTEMKVNISRLSKGVYYLKVKTDSKIFQFKILKE